MMAQILDRPRRLLLQLVEQRATDLATVSRQLKRNHAYLFQYVRQNKPRQLPEDVREALGELFEIDPDLFRAGEQVMRRAGTAGGEARDSGQFTVAELDVRAGGASGQFVESAAAVGERGLPSEVIRLTSRSLASQIKIIKTIGDSMEPTYRPGDRIMVDTGDVSPSPPGVFVVWDGLGFVIKRVEFVPHSDPPMVRLASDNPKYSTYERAVGEAYIQGRVIGKWLWS